MSFTIKRFKDNYILSNTDNNVLELQINKQIENCTNYEQVKDIINIQPNKSHTVKLYQDGKYKLIVTEGISEEEIIILHYSSLLYSIISDIQYILCECAVDLNCSDCGNTSEINKQLSVILKILSYQKLTHPRHAAFLETLFEPLKCSIDELTSNIILEEKMNGNADYIQLLEKILSYYYLSFYFSEVKTSSEEELDYINTKFQYQNLFNCINSDLITDAENRIDNMGTFTVISGAYVNLPPTTGDNTIEVPNRFTKTLDLSMFTSQTTPPYNDPEGDVVDALRVNSIDGNNQGVFYYDNTPIIQNLIIPAQHIVDGRFTHEGPDADTILNDEIDFSLRDIGSMQWSS